MGVTDFNEHIIEKGTNISAGAEEQNNSDSIPNSHRRSRS
jgi:hypothetical protein